MKRFIRKICFLIFISALVFSFLAKSQKTNAAEISWENSRINTDYSAIGIVFDRDNKMYVTDWTNNRLKRYNTDGQLDDTWPYNNTNIGSSPISLYFDEHTNTIWVAGQNSSDKIWIINLDTYEKEEISLSGEIGGLLVDGEGNYYVNLRGKLQKYSPDGDLIWQTEADADIGLTMDNEGSLYMSKETGRRIVKVLPEGLIDTSFGNNGYLTLTSTMDGTSITGNIGLPSFYDNTLYVACYASGLVVKISGDGQYVEKVVEGASPVMFVRHENKYFIPHWLDGYIEYHGAPKIDIDENFSVSIEPDFVYKDSLDEVEVLINSDSDKDYEVQAQVFELETGNIMTDITSSIENLVDGDAKIFLTPPSSGWEKGLYGINLIFTNRVGALAVSDSLEIEEVLAVGYYRVSYDVGANGSIDNDENYIDADDETTISFNLLPDPGYMVDPDASSVSNGELSFDNNRANITDISGNLDVNIVFALIPPKINLQPEGGNYLRGDDIQPLLVEVVVPEASLLSYQWYLNNSPIEGATEINYKPESKQTGLFDYHVEITLTREGTEESIAVTSQKANLLISSVGIKDIDYDGISLDKEELLNSLMVIDENLLDRGYDITYSLLVDLIESLTAEEENLARPLLENSERAFILDIGLNRRLVDLEGKEVHEAINYLPDKLEITIDIPEDLREEGRNFFVVRLHDGVGIILRDLDDKPNTITFETDRFSTYVFAYESLAETETSPPTGNGSILSLAVLLFPGFSLLLKKRKEVLG